PQFSHDTKWLAYTSDENEPGRFQVYVVSFPAAGLKQQISTEGGGQPRWSPDDKALYYRTLDNRYMAVDLKLGAKIEPSVPTSIFPAPTVQAVAGDPTRHQWSIASDGRMMLRVPLGATLGAATGSAAG